MTRLSEKVAFVTGAGGGVGRSLAVSFAEEGAAVIAVDLGKDLETVPYAQSSSDELDETARLVKEAGGSIVTRIADVRNQDELDAAVEAGVEEFGGLDIVCPNAGVYAGVGNSWEFTEEQWLACIDVNLNGAWKTIKAGVPHLLKTGRAGSVVFTASINSIKGEASSGHYSASKHGLLGLARSMAQELAPHMIRVNAVCPTGVRTRMMDNEITRGFFRPDLDKPTMEDIEEAAAEENLLPVPWVEPEDVANAIIWLCSEEARYVTGVALPVDAGYLTK